MFKSIKIEKGPIHGEKEFTFTTGSTAIIGDNGCGKSLLVEYMSFVLFGSVALRGKLADYKDLSVSAWVSIKGKDYKIERDTKMCKLFDSTGKLLCTGTKPCNIKICSTLGYDYNVYKMGNYAAQLDILGLGNMKPSERKTALDRTLGISIIDKLIKYTNDKSLEYSHQEKALQGVAQEPGEEPVKPSGYRPLEEVYIEYSRFKKEYDDYQVFKTKPAPVAPVNPERHFPARIKEISLNKISIILFRKKEIENELKRLENIIKPAHSKEELKALEEANVKYEEYQNYLKRVEFYLDKEKPSLTQEQYDQQLEANLKWTNYDSEMIAYRKGSVDCPHCGHTFNVDMDCPKEPEIARPIYTMSELNEQAKLLDYQNEFNKIATVEPFVKPILQKSQIMEELQLWKKWEERQEKEPQLRQELDSFPPLNQGDVTLRADYEKLVAQYQVAVAAFEKENLQYTKEKERFLDFNEYWVKSKIDELATLYQQCQDYDREKQVWDLKKEAYDKVANEIKLCQKQKGTYKQASENLKEMKVKIKGYALPSLQKVSSRLLSDMSNGQFTDIKISPDFDILVEGREINLFSGSEQAMINLALRLGLGQVLTYRVFSVFIGDEIDASMRDDRAQSTADCLKKISKYINQVILVSHRDIEADHYINLNGD